MKKGIVNKEYWGIKSGEIIYINDSGKMKSNAIGIYDSNKNFVVYVFDKEMLLECVEIVCDKNIPCCGCAEMENCTLKKL